MLTPLRRSIASASSRSMSRRSNGFIHWNDDEKPRTRVKYVWVSEDEVPASRGWH